MKDNENNVLGYKIRRKSDGLCLNKGGSAKRWTKRGHVWNTLGYAVASIKSQGLGDAEIMDLEIIELAETNRYSSAYILDRLVK